MGNLEQTRGRVKLEGKVVGLENENSYREGFTKSDKEYKSFSFFVQTSKENRIRVELFGMIRDEVIAYSNKDKKSKRIPWDDRASHHGDYKVMGTTLYLEKDAKGKKNKRVVLVEYDAIDYIRESMKDGDSVRVMASYEPQVYENSSGEEVSSNRFTISSITALDKEIDFDSEDFKEVSVFEQEMVVVDTLVDREEQKLLVTAKLIKYNGDHVETSFVVDAEKYPKLAKNMARRMKFGDFIKVYGLALNKTVLTEVEDEEEDDWGGDDDIKSEISSDFIRDFVQEMQITSVDSATYEPKKYNEDDFIDEDEDAFNGDTGFGDDEDDDDFEDDEELPFK